MHNALWNQNTFYIWAYQIIHTRLFFSQSFFLSIFNISHFFQQLNSTTKKRDKTKKSGENKFDLLSHDSWTEYMKIK